MTSHQNPDLTYINKKEYRKFCQKEKNIPIFSQDWWLDAVCGEQNWDVVIARKNNQIVATLPYYLQNKFYYRIINMPLFTQTMGPYLKYPQNLNEYKKLSFEKEIMVQLIDQLPQFDLFVQNFHHSITNWLPFYWAHFSQTTRYTYIIEELSDINDIYANLYSSTKRHINNAKMILRIKENCDLELVYRINKNTLQKSQCSLDYSFDLLKRIDDSCIKNNCRKIIYAEDENHNVHAVIYLVWDNNNIYDFLFYVSNTLRSENDSIISLSACMNIEDEFSFFLHLF